MGKISDTDRNKYLERINQYKKNIEEIEQREKFILSLIQKESSGIEVKKLRLADENINLISYYVLMNTLSINLLGVKNEPYLNNARKIFYKVLKYFEDVVSDSIDGTLTDLVDHCKPIDGWEHGDRWRIISKMGYAYQSIVDGYGENTKWKWSFVELDGRMATIVKNLLPFRTLYSDLDPSKDDYPIKLRHLNLATRLLDQAANRYREKYELATSRIDDFRLAIKYLDALRRLYSMLNRAAEADNYKKKMDIWLQKLETDMKKKDIKSR